MTAPIDICLRLRDHNGQEWVFCPIPTVTVNAPSPPGPVSPIPPTEAMIFPVNPTGKIIDPGSGLGLFGWVTVGLIVAGVAGFGVIRWGRKSRGSQVADRGQW